MVAPLISGQADSSVAASIFTGRLTLTAGRVWVSGEGGWWMGEEPMGGVEGGVRDEGCERGWVGWRWWWGVVMGLGERERERERESNYSRAKITLKLSLSLSLSLPLSQRFSHSLRHVDTLTHASSEASRMHASTQLSPKSSHTHTHTHKRASAASITNQ